MQAVIQYGGLVLFAVVLAEQIGLPIPAAPMLVAAGTLAGMGRMSLALVIGVPVAAAMLGDLLWYVLGRRLGRPVLGILCRISLEPDACVRRTENAFTRHGVRALLVAKFIPGLSTVAPPLAGIFGVGLARFAAYDGLGALFWVETNVALGYLFSHHVERLAGHMARLGTVMVAGLAGATAAYIAFKFIRRHRLLRRLRIARILPEELRSLLDGGAPLTIVDLRTPLDVEAAPYAIPGALRLAPDEVERRHHEIPRDRDIVLYCT